MTYISSTNRQTNHSNRKRTNVSPHSLGIQTICKVYVGCWLWQHETYSSDFSTQMRRDRQWSSQCAAYSSNFSIQMSRDRQWSWQCATYSSDFSTQISRNRCWLWQCVTYTTAAISAHRWAVFGERVLQKQGFGVGVWCHVHVCQVHNICLYVSVPACACMHV